VGIEKIKKIVMLVKMDWKIKRMDEINMDATKILIMSTKNNFKPMYFLIKK
jgi:hypothetical protein